MRCAGSTDSHRFRTSTCPSGGWGLDASSMVEPLVVSNITRKVARIGCFLGVLSDLSQQCVFGLISAKSLRPNSLPASRHHEQPASGARTDRRRHLSRIFERNLAVVTSHLPFEEKQSRPGTGYWFGQFFEYAALAGADEHAPRRRWFGERRKSEDQVGLPKGSRSVRARGNAAAQRAAITQNPCAPKWA
jgi:hypothetical protein